MKLARFPFVVKNRSVIVHAPSLANALNRVLLKHPNKFIKTTYARNVAKHQKTMDLINAQKEAKSRSEKTKGVVVYVILEDDEFIVKNFDEVKAKDDVYSAWRDGTKYDKKEEQTEQPVKTKTAKVVKLDNTNEEQLTTNKMEPKEKTVKKTVKKVAAKKSAKKSAKKAAPKNAKKLVPSTARRQFTPGKVVDISIKDMRANIKKGFTYRDPQGVIQTDKYMATRTNQDYVRTSMHEYKPEKK